MPHVSLGVYGFIICLFSCGLAIGVVVAVGLLFIMEFKAVVRNRTGIEDWIVDKANDRLETLEQRREEEERIRQANQKSGVVPKEAGNKLARQPARFLYPYDLGCWGNFKDVFSW